MSRIDADALLLHSRAAADCFGVPIKQLARLLPAPDRIIKGRRHWLMSTLERTRRGRVIALREETPHRPDVGNP